MLWSIVLWRKIWFSIIIFNYDKYDDTEIIRLFPLEDEPYGYEKSIDMGMISVRKNNETPVENEEDLFIKISKEVKENIYKIEISVS